MNGDLRGLATMVTGHRPQHLRPLQREWAAKELAEVMGELCPSGAISGMALGADIWWAAAAVNTWHRPLHAFLPFPPAIQSAKWPEQDTRQYMALLEQASEVTVLGDHYAPKFFHARNVVMVRACEVVVALWDGRWSGGTAGAVNLARKAGRPVIRLDPESKSVEWPT